MSTSLRDELARVGAVTTTRELMISAGIIKPDAPLTPVARNSPVLRLDDAGRRAAAEEVRRDQEWREQKGWAP